MGWDENWLEENEQVDGHELMIDSGCFGRVFFTMVCTAVPSGEFFKCQGSGSNRRGTATLRTENRLRLRDDEQWQTSIGTNFV